MDTYPKITFAILSWNRFHYLKATLESALACLQYPNMEWMVSDNESDEPGLAEYLDAHPRLDRVLRKKQTHADAMNELIQVAQGEYIFIWPEDVQFVVKGDWLEDLVEIMEANPDIGSVGVDGQRRSTLNGYFRPSRVHQVQWAARDLKAFRKVRTLRTLQSKRGLKLFTLGGAAPGVCGSGIPTLTRTSLWRELGGWKTGKATGGLIDSSLGAEDQMVETFYRSGRPLQMGHLYRPVAADIVTDTLGCKAKVRGPYRFGDYMPPPEGTFYYRIQEASAFEGRGEAQPLSFSDITEPMGFTLPKDAAGDRLKFSFNSSIVHHIAEGRTLEHPLRDPDVVSRIT
ncbi:MAG: glycosyltransferase [Verrucomicrobia bacterium]|nr:glycosyltransferase [Verrucomicrobiota bacterium]MCH8526426.1 glycosyltransferase [Kiritimatiellia bacterium]